MFRDIGVHDHLQKKFSCAPTEFTPLFSSYLKPQLDSCRIQLGSAMLNAKEPLGSFAEDADVEGIWN
jgi:hypothetical protein